MTPTTLQKMGGKTNDTLRSISLLLGCVSAATMLTSCQSPQGATGNTPDSASHEAVYRINVLQYPAPIEVLSWVPDPNQAVNSEGAALNTVTAMQRGDVDAWLACWGADERPKLAADERQKLMKEWQSLKEGRVSVVGRVVAAGDLIVEISVEGPQQKPELLQLPLKRNQGRWWLTVMDPNNEYMRWQNSPRKLVEEVDPTAFRKYLHDVKAIREN